MAASLREIVEEWIRRCGLGREGASALANNKRLDDFPSDAVRPPVSPERLRRWELAHGFQLPQSLRNWLQLSDGLYQGSPLIHPLSAIGPMIPFARVPDLVIQPESWFELGNPGEETICIDLGYCLPDGGHPIFTSGDDLRSTSPRIISPSFDDWLFRLLAEGGHPFWFDAGYRDLGDPWREHKLRVPVPPLPERLRELTSEARPLLHSGADDRSIARRLGISLGDVEALFRHIQHEVIRG